MRKFVLVLFFIFIFGLVFSVPITLVNYYDDSVMSHSCLSSDPLCTYQNSINIDSNFVSDSTSGINILNLSDSTNAHVEINNNLSYVNGNYSNKIFMVNNIFSSGLCEFTSVSGSCSTGKICLFGVSGESNAHLSKCGVFSNEIKFCCVPQVISGVPPSTDISSDCDVYSFEIKPIMIDSNVSISFSCKENVDANLLFYNVKGDILDGPVSVSCGLNSSSYNNFILDEPQVIGVKIYTDKCEVERFVNVSKGSDRGFSIPDNNIFVVLLLFGLVIFLVKRKS